MDVRVSSDNDIATMTSPFDTLVQDLRAAVRGLRRSPAFTTWVVGSLTIGMGVTVAALAFLNALAVLPFPGVIEQDRMVRLSLSRNCGTPDCWSPMTSLDDYLALRQGIPGLQDLAAYAVGELPASLPQARSMRAALTTVNYFSVLGVRPGLGRVFDSKDAEREAPVAVISHTVWTREFRSDPSVLGRSIRVADTFVEIVGIAPPSFVGIDLRPARGDRTQDIWLPVWLAARVLPATRGERIRQQRALEFVGRMKDGVELQQLRAEANVVAARLVQTTRPGSHSGRAIVVPLGMANPEHRLLGIAVVMPVPILVLAIACVNAANLMLARGSSQRREIAICLAIGAGRARVIRQLLVESAVLASLSAAVALPLAAWSLEFSGSPLNIPTPIDATVLALTFLTVAGTTVVFGLAPAIRISAESPATTFGFSPSRSDATPRQSRTRNALLIAQIALSLGLLATGSQLVSTVRAQDVSAGTPGDRLLIARFDVAPLEWPHDKVEAFYRDVMANALHLPAVAAAGMARHTSVWSFREPAPSSLIVWRPADGPEEGQLIMGGYAGGDLFAALGLRVVSGRHFTEADRQMRPRVAIVNESAANDVHGPVVGSTIRVAPRGGDYRSAIEVRIVGIIESALEPRLERGALPAAKVYLPSPIVPEPALSLYLRTEGQASAAAQPLRELVSRMAPRVPIQELGSLEELNERAYAPQLWLAKAAAVLGLVGLLLATAGLYGISSYVVAMRTREIAIRIAVGATPQAIVRMVLRQWMRIAAIGLVLGGTAALIVSRMIQSGYHGIGGIDPVALGGSSVLFLAAMLLTSAAPAIRASRVDPIESLKD